MATDSNVTSASLHEFCLDLIGKAGGFTLGHFRNDALAVEHKSDGSPVTLADHGAEELMREQIHTYFPHDSILGEEGDDHHGTSGRRWVIDPIDGTKAFARGVGLYTNLLSVEDGDGPLIGAINMPALGEIVHAERGAGCFLNGSSCRVSDVDDPAKATLTTTGFDYWDEEILGSVWSSDIAMRTWGDGYGYALVASGRAEVMIDPMINYWDIAPCRIIIPEAGGIFTAVDGSPYDNSPDSVATNVALHDWAIRTLNPAA